MSLHSSVKLCIMAKLPMILALCLLAVTSVDLQLFESFQIVSSRDIARHINSQKQAIGLLLNVDGDTNLSELFPTISAANQSKLQGCYNSSVGGEQFNIFENTIFDVIKGYYKFFPENFQIASFGDNVKSLFKSVNEIGDHTVKCLAKQSNFQLGLTQLTDFSDAEYRVLLGARKESEPDYLGRPLRKGKTNEANEDESNESDGGDEDDKNKKKSDERSRSKRQDVSVDPICFPKNKSKLPQKFDWRSMGKVTPAKYQGSCGSCWAFAAIACLESAYLIKGKTNDKNFDLSEQQLVGCAKSEGCNGGTSVDAFNFILTNNGVTDEKSLPYDHKKIKCVTKKKKRVAKIKDYCLRGIYAKVNGKPENLTDEDIQHVIREFGPVYATMDADHLAVKHHKSGIYTNPKCPKITNHAITIVGWTKRSWIIKNSWGRKWADNGFFKMKRGVNLCGINTYITYPIV